jgi:hypothetical protein
LCEHTVVGDHIEDHGHILRSIARPLAVPPICDALAVATGSATFDDVLAHEMLTEFEVRSFDQHLAGRVASWTRAFAPFRSRWRRDERAHYMGFRYIRRLTGVSAEALAAELETAGTPDFEPIEPFIRDDLSLCVLLAFEELVTILGYRSNVPIYDAAGDAGLTAWIRRVTRDEGGHYAAVIAMLRTVDDEDRRRAVAVAERLIDHDSSQPAYRRTLRWIMTSARRTFFAPCTIGWSYLVNSRASALGRPGSRAGDPEGRRRDHIGWPSDCPSRRS